MKHKRISLFLLMLISISFWSHALTAEETLKKAHDKLATAKSVTADFKIKQSDKSFSGKLTSKGSKFSIISSYSSNWYDGKDLWTYNPSSSETTVIKPSSSDLALANPLLYLNSSSNYKATLPKQKKKGMETLILVPKTKGSGVKNITLDLDPKTYLPTAITLVTSSGQTISVTISNIKLNSAIDDSAFTYPKSKYPKSKIVDLR